MKGMELPLNAVVILIIAVTVFMVLIFFFTSQSSSGFSTIEADKAHAEACITLRDLPFACRHETVNQIPANYAGHSLGSLCAAKGFGSSISCAKSCGCGDVGTSPDVPLSTQQRTQTVPDSESGSVFGVDILEG